VFTPPGGRKIHPVPVTQGAGRKVLDDRAQRGGRSVDLYLKGAVATSGAKKRGREGRCDRRRREEERRRLARESAKPDHRGGADFWLDKRKRKKKKTTLTHLLPQKEPRTALRQKGEGVIKNAGALPLQEERRVPFRLCEKASPKETS